MAESEEEQRRLLIKVKEDSKKAGLKLNIQTSQVVQWIRIRLPMRRT